MGGEGGDVFLSNVPMFTCFKRNKKTINKFSAIFCIRFFLPLTLNPKHVVGTVGEKRIFRSFGGQLLINKQHLKSGDDDSMGKISVVPGITGETFFSTFSFSV